MIITVTPNPSLDLLFSAERLVWNDANRIPMPRRRAGGQGINVARAVRALAPDASVRAIAPLGGPVGRELREMLEAEGTPLTGVEIGAETRVFVGVRERETGRSLLLNPRGPAVTEADGDVLLDAMDEVLRTSPAPAWVVASGSLLPGLPADFYARAGERARSLGARFVPDGDGPALAAAVPVADLLVPNELEAGRLVERSVATPEDAAAAGQVLLGRGPERVVITLGDRGAVWVDDTGAWWARAVPPSERAPVLETASAVGAGDAFLAALLLAIRRDTPPPDALAAAAAAGTATLLSRGTDLVRREDADEVRRWVEVAELDG